MAKLVKHIPDDLSGKRDKALILIGFAATLRRSELVALEVADVERAPDGIVLHIHQSTTDQEGQGAQIAAPTDPFCLTPEWRELRRRTLFRFARKRFIMPSV